MRRKLSMALAGLFCFLLLTGMGDLGGAPDGAIPEPEENIRAVVTDRQGVSTELSRFSMAGKTFLEGARGNGRVTVDFRHMDRLDFEPKSGDMVPVTLSLRQGEPLRLQVRTGAVFFGSTGYGTFQIRARDVQRIEFPQQ